MNYLFRRLDKFFHAELEIGNTDTDSWFTFITLFSHRAAIFYIINDIENIFLYERCHVQGRPFWCSSKLF